MKPPPGSIEAARSKSSPATQAQLDRERHHQVRGLLLLAIAAIVFAILRAGVHRVFSPGWWRLW